MSRHVSVNSDRDLRAEAQALLDAGEISKAELAKNLGYDRSTIGRYLDGTYGGRTNNIEAALGKFLDTRANQAEVEAQLPTAPAYFETPTSRIIYSKLKFAHAAGAITCIYGGAGVGKTETIRKYAADNGGVFTVTVTPNTSRQQALLARIAAVLGIRSNAVAYMLEQSVFDRLRGVRALLIIDEAQHLSPRSLESLRAIHDETGVGLALLGNENVYGRMTGGDRTEGFAQLFSRIATKKRLAQPLSGDVDAVLDAWSITDPDARKACHDIASRPGALRGLSYTLRLATMYATGKKQQQLTRQHIRAAWSELGGEGIHA